MPIIVYGTTVLADDSISTTGGALPAIDPYMDGPDVFYDFTPAASGTYRIEFTAY